MTTAKEITRMTGATLVGNPDTEITRILTDSRSLCFPEETLFFALRSRKADGHKYIPQLYTRGVRAFVVDHLPEESGIEEKMPGAAFLIVEDTLKALQRLAGEHRKRFDVPVIGITGSNGKTIVKEWLATLLAEEMRVTRSPRSYNSQTGVPLSVWLMDGQTQVGIFEAGISESGEMAALQRIIQPTIGVLTNIGSAHQENFYSLQEKCMEKLHLFKGCDVIIYNGDDPVIRECVAKAGLTTKEIAWSKTDDDRPLFIRSVRREEKATTIGYRFLGMEGEYYIPFIDEASVENSISCLAVCLYLMLPPEQITRRMALLEPVAMRLEVKEGKHGCTLVGDTYNSDPASLDIALDFVARRAGSKERRRSTLILSDMLETGLTPKMLYRKVAAMVENRHIDKILGVGEEITASAEYFTMEKHFFASTEELLVSEELEGLRDEVILVKGARKFRFENVIDRLEQKVHETILETDLGALAANFSHYRNFLKPETKMVCMVKASAYGAGACETAKTLQELHADYLAVAVADEGVTLRKAGITCPIMIMNPELSAFKTMFDHRLEPEVYSFHLLDELIKAAGKEGITGFPIHIKVDTGMHRLGFLPEEIQRLTETLKAQNAVVPRSVFSHFAGSDSGDFDDFTQLQTDRFTRAADELQAAFSHRILRHICNSAGISRFSDRQMDMVRLGLGLYGIDPTDNSILNPVSTLKTTILQIHELPEGETVGYSRRERLERKSRIAALPIGYADGLDRRLGNRNAYCLVNGQQAPYVGNICMDVCMIDVTDIDCKEGDTAVIFGKELPVTVLSDLLGTIPYEILTGISERVKRIYFRE